jgi:hypothetical protein
MNPVLNGKAQIQNPVHILDSAADHNFGEAQVSKELPTRSGEIDRGKCLDSA